MSYQCIFIEDENIDLPLKINDNTEKLIIKIKSTRELTKINNLIDFLPEHIIELYIRFERYFGNDDIILDNLPSSLKVLSLNGNFSSKFLITTNNIIKLIIDSRNMKIDKKIDEIYINLIIDPLGLNNFLKNLKLNIVYLPNKLSFISECEYSLLNNNLKLKKIL